MYFVCIPVALAENSRLKTLIPVINCFNGVMSSIRGEIVCQIVTAKVCFKIFKLICVGLYNQLPINAVSL